MPSFRFEPLDPERHDRDGFECGVPALNDYLRQQARKDAERHLAAVFVMVAEAAPSTIIGFYSLSNFSVELAELPAELIRKLPRYPRVPATLIGRLARDQRFPGTGSLLLMDALLRAYAQTAVSGSVTVVAEAKDESAGGFYRKHGFVLLGLESNRWHLPMETIGRLD
ncbi:MAG: GNAT family N-acetyltransferase [Opitutaceae bacterium]